MLTSTKSKFFISFEYIFIFIVTSLVFFFMIPQVDVFWLSYGAENNLSSVFNASLFYGNGRFLGNFIGTLLSINFQYAFLLVSIALTSIIAMLNYLTFNNKYAVIPLAILVLFPSSAMMSETYFLFASFCNYTLPIALTLLSVSLIKYLDNSKSKRTLTELIASVIIAVSSLASGLFSENTSIVIFVWSLLICFASFKAKSKIKPHHIMNVIGTTFGLVLMFAIPRLTDTAALMDGYRSVSFDLNDIVASFVKFSEVISNQTFVIIMVSVALIFLCYKKSRLNTSIKTVFSIYFALFPILGFVLKDFRPEAFYLSRVNFSVFFGMALYILLSTITIFSIENKKLRLKGILYGLLISSSIAPMMFVTQHGYRVYYITFILLILFALDFIKIIVSEIDFSFERLHINTKQILKYSCVCITLIFTLISTTIFIQGVYNYRFYVYRTDTLYDQIESVDISDEETYIEAYFLPCQAIVTEDEYYNQAFAILGYDEFVKNNKKNIPIYNSASKYYEDLEYMHVATVFDSIKFNLNHLEYKNPFILVNKLK